MASPELPFATWRLRNVPSGWDIKQLHAIIPLKEREEVLYSSLTPYHYFKNANQVGTITWNCVPGYLRQSGSKDSLRVESPSKVDPTIQDDLGAGVKQNEVIADSEFIGLTPLIAIKPPKECVK